MKRERFKLSIAVFMFLIKGDEILLIKRSNTGYKDNYFSVPAGGLDAGETIQNAAIREAFEETGVTIDIKDVTLAHTQHCFIDGENWIGVYFMAETWSGEPQVKEPHKHSEVKWVSSNSLPDDLLPYVRQALESYRQDILYSEFTS